MAKKMKNWRLPNKEELNFMYQNLKTKDIGGFADYYYWSSSEDSANDAWNQYFSDGYQDGHSEGDSFYVRAVRDFKSKENYNIGEKTETGIIFFKKGNYYKECKFIDEPERITWDEAVKYFKSEYAKMNSLQDAKNKNKYISMLKKNKFRSWISSIQQFTYFENGIYSWINKELNVPVFDWENAEQYINRKDCEGNELYENDIFEITAGDGWIIGKHIVKMNLDTLEIDDRIIGKRIGNIHQTPELMR